MFNEKMKKMSIEIERKFLVTDDSYKALAYHSDRIAQGYLCREGGNSTRVRVRGDKGYLTIKGPSLDGGLSRFECESEIPYKVAELLLQRCSGVVDKVRHIVEFEGHTFEIDEFKGENEGLIIAEVELSQADESITLTSWIGDEVTGERCFYNSFLVKHPFRSWKIKKA